MVDSPQLPQLDLDSPGNDPNVLEAKQYYVFSATGNILLRTTIETSQLLEENVRNVFSEVSVFYAAMTKAIASTTNPATNQPYSIYNCQAIKSAIEGSGLFVQVTDEDFTFETDSVGTDFCKELLEAVLGFEMGSAGLSFARALVASVGKEAARMAASEAEQGSEAGNIIFVGEYLLGMPMVSAILVSLKSQTKTHQDIKSGPCFQKHSETKVTTTWELNKETYFFLTPTIVRKYAGDLDRVIYEPNYIKAISWLQSFVKIAPPPKKPPKFTRHNFWNGTMLDSGKTVSYRWNEQTNFWEELDEGNLGKHNFREIVNTPNAVTFTQNGGAIFLTTEAAYWEGNPFASGGFVTSL